MLGMGSCYCRCDHFEPTTLWKLNLADLSTVWFANGISVGSVRPVEFRDDRVIETNGSSTMQWVDEGAAATEEWTYSSGGGSVLAVADDAIWPVASGTARRLDRIAGTLLSSGSISVSQSPFPYGLWSTAGSTDVIAYGPQSQAPVSTWGSPYVGSTTLTLYSSAYAATVTRTVNSALPAKLRLSAAPDTEWIVAYTDGYTVNQFFGYSATNGKIRLYNSQLTQIAVANAPQVVNQAFFGGFAVGGGRILFCGNNHALVQCPASLGASNLRLVSLPGLATIFDVNERSGLSGVLIPAYGHGAIDDSGNSYYALTGAGALLVKRDAAGAVVWTADISDTTPPGVMIGAVSQLLLDQTNGHVLLVGGFRDSQIGIRAHSMSTGAITHEHHTGFGPDHLLLIGGFTAGFAAIDGDYVYVASMSGSSEFQSL